MQRQAILSRHEDTREALAQIGARGGVAARFREVAFPIASVKEHQSRTETFARRSILCDASAPQRLARKPYCLGPTVESDPSEGVDSTRCKSASMLHVGVGLRMSSVCGTLASVLDGISVGFSTRRDEPSKREFSSIDNDR